MIREHPRELQTTSYDGRNPLQCATFRNRPPSHRCHQRSRRRRLRRPRRPCPRRRFLADPAFARFTIRVNLLLRLKHSREAFYERGGDNACSRLIFSFVV